MNFLFYFKRLKVNKAFCILLLLSGCSDKKPLEITELVEVTEQEFWANQGIIKSSSAKVTFSNCKFYLPKKQKKLAPVGITESKIYIKLSRDVEMEYINFLKFKDRWAKKDFSNAKSMLEFLDRVDRPENYKFIERSN